MLSETHLSPYGLMKALTNIDNETNKTIEDITEKTAKKTNGSNKVGHKTENPMQNKTGDYGKKRKPGDYLK